MRRQVVIQTGRNVVDGENLPGWGSFQIKSQIEVGSLLVSTTFWTHQHQTPTIRTNY